MKLLSDEPAIFPEGTPLAQDSPATIEATVSAVNRSFLFESFAGLPMTCQNPRKNSRKNNITKYLTSSPYRWIGAAAHLCIRAPLDTFMKHIKSLSLATLLLALAALSLPAFAQSQGISGERCYARITFNRKPFNINPNQVGTFHPTIDGFRAQTQIKLEVIYPSGQADQKVTLTALEGGTLGNGLETQDLTLDSLKTASFTFATGAGRGLYRVSVLKGTDEKILEFWVGEKMPKYPE